MRTHTLVSFDLCPFVQRSSITLQHKGVAHDIRYIDLFDKPEWFLKISPFGKVPLLLVEEEGTQTVLFESAVINEYLDEITAEAGHERMHPADTLERGVHRAWIELGSALAGQGYMLSMAGDQAGVDKHLAATQATLARFEDAIGERRFFGGDALCLVDTAVAPALQRLLWLDELWPELGIFAESPKVRAWGERMVRLPEVQASTVPDIRDRFLTYLRGGGSPKRQAEPSAFGRRLAT